MRRLARMLMSGLFIVGGSHAFSEPGPRVGMAEKAGVPEPEFMVRANGVVMVVAGASLGLSLLPRLSAAVLAASMVPTTIAGHAFWNEDDPVARQRQQIQFLKNTAVLGGLVMMAVDRGKRS